MTLPASGTISFQNFNTEMGQASNFSSSLSWIKANTKAGQESNSLSGYYGKAWFNKNNDGNCSNGNCTANCNCGNIQCTNCVIAGTVNCVNCDARAWLQSNCNCACTYNCSAGLVSYNCNCDCNCACNSCFLQGSLVLMADGSFQPIETVEIGDKVQGGGGILNTVLAYDRPRLGSRPMYRINGEHQTTNEHAHFGPGGIYAIDAASFALDRSVKHVATLADGRREYRDVPFIDPAKVTNIEIGTVLFTPAGNRAVESIERLRHPGDTPLFNLIVDGSRTYFVNGYLVSGWAGEDDFDYSTWSRKC